MAEHEKIIISESRFGFPAYADYYHYGPASGKSVPFMLYIGGYVEPLTYRQRMQTVPDVIARTFEEVLETRAESADLLVIPNPMGDDADLLWFREQFRLHLVFDLLPQTGNPRPTTMGVVGYSLGAYLAAALALDQPQVGAAALIGGTEMSLAVEEIDPEAAGSKKFMAYGNGDDPFAMENYHFMQLLVHTAHSVDVELGDGGHDFDDYVKNGFVAQAFAFALLHARAH